MKLPKIISPNAAYFWGGVCIVIAIALMILGPLAQGALWVIGIGVVLYGLALQFAPDELEKAKAHVKTAADAAKAASKTNAGS